MAGRQARLGNLVVGHSATLSPVWFVAMVVSLCVIGWLAVNAVGIAVGAALVAAAAAFTRHQWLREARKAGRLELLADGNWVARGDGADEVLVLKSAFSCQGAIFATFSGMRGRFGVIVSPGSAGGDSFRRLLVRLGASQGGREA